MGRAWTSSPGWGLVEEASDAVGRDLARLLLDADAEELRRPREAQVSTFLTSLLALEALRADGILDALGVVGVAGHSLGEYTALVAAEVVSRADGLRLVAERGEAMQAAADNAPGTMAAVLGLDDAVVESLCRDARGAGSGVWPANFNAPAQVVVSGTTDGVADASERATAAGARRILPIPVGGAYHTPLMEPARERLEAALAEVAYSDAALPVTANVDAHRHVQAGDWRDLLSAQLTSPVRWRQTLASLATEGVTTVVEVGPGGVLTGLAKRGAPDCKAYSVSGPDEVASLRQALGTAP